MTVAPKYPLTHAYEGENPYELIPSSFGVMERWRVNAMQTGETSALIELSKKVYNDTIAAADNIAAREADITAREAACDVRERQIAVHATLISHLMGRIGAEQDRLDKIKADAAEEPLPLPPGHNLARSAEPDPPLSSPSATDAALPGDPSPPTEGTDPGEFPRLNRPITRDQDEPPAGGVEFPDPELPHPPVVEQPIAAGLDQDD